MDFNKIIKSCTENKHVDIYTNMSTSEQWIGNRNIYLIGKTKFNEDSIKPILKDNGEDWDILEYETDEKFDDMAKERILEARYSFTVCSGKDTYIILFDEIGKLVFVNKSCFAPLKLTSEYKFYMRGEYVAVKKGMLLQALIKPEYFDYSNNFITKQLAEVGTYISRAMARIEAEDE
ncbi:MAG: hypothetical protein LKJ25_08705 [Clostridia bacterium]|jgi:hypothetical protein|nr:hypothetical protein [Clostridia bacterium]